MTLSDRIADVRRKAVEAKDAYQIVAPESNQQDLTVALNKFLRAASPDLIIAWAEERDRDKARIEELEKDRDEAIRQRDEYFEQIERAENNIANLQLQVDEARNKALDEAAERAGRLLGYYDGKAVTAAILALKTKEPTP